MESGLYSLVQDKNVSFSGGWGSLKEIMTVICWWSLSVVPLSSLPHHSAVHVVLQSSMGMEWNLRRKPSTGPYSMQPGDPKSRFSVNSVDSQARYGPCIVCYTDLV